MSAAAAPSPTTGPPRLPYLVALIAVVLAGIAVALVPRTYQPLDVDAPADVFSAGRAAAHIEAIAANPRPPGTPAHTAARDDLVTALEELGARAEVQTGVGWLAPPGLSTQRGGQVHNVVGRWAGTDPTGTVVLAAHYDTVRGSPGAGDDGIGVGTVLEVARTLVAGGPLRNDLVVLVTDGEEAGLLGAQRFTSSNDLREPVVVLNHEARGNSGTPTTFRMTSPNGMLVDVLASAPGADADSLTQLLFEILPNDTDFRLFDEAGFHGYDTAITGGAAYYHSPLDTTDRLSRESLQHMGVTTSAMVQQLAGSDLSGIDDAGDAVVSGSPWGLLHAPRAVEAVGALLLAVVVGSVLVIRVRRGECSPEQIGGAAAVALPAGILAAGAAFLPWWAARSLAPGMSAPVADEPYRPGWFQAAAILAAVGILVTVLVWWARRRPPAAFTCGALTVPALLALVTIPFPGVASALVLLTLPAAVGILVAITAAARSVWWRLGATTIGTALSVLWGAYAAEASFDAGLLYGAPLAGLFVALTFAATLPLWEPVVSSVRLRFGITAPLALTVVVALAATLAGGYVNRDGATDPRQEYLWYSLDSDRDAAVWGSPDPPRSDWTRALLTESPARMPDEFPWQSGRPLSSGPAPVAPLEPPDVDVIEDRGRGSAREVRLRLTTRRDADAIGLWVDEQTAYVHGATVDGHAAEPAENFGFMFWAPGPDGVEVTLTLSMRESELGVRVADWTDDPEVIPGYRPPENRVVVQPTVAVTRSLRFRRHSHS